MSAANKGRKKARRKENTGLNRNVDDVENDLIEEETESKAVNTNYTGHYLLNQLTSLTQQVDTNPFIEDAFKTLYISTVDKTRSYHIITDAIRNREQAALKGYAALIERVPIFVETIRTYSEIVALSQLVKELANYSHVDASSHWLKSVTKIVNTAVKYVTKMITLKESADVTMIHNFALFFITLLESEIRSLLIPQLKTIVDISWQIISLDLSLSNDSYTSTSALRNLAIEIISLSRTLEVTDRWQSSWQQATEFLQYTLHYLHSNKLSLQSAHTTIGEQAINSLKTNIALDWSMMDNQKGVQKAMLCLQLVDIATTLVDKMLAAGCTAGFISLDVSILVSLLQHVLLVQVDTINAHDPANFIENDVGLSVIDVSFVISQVKLKLLTPLHTLISTHTNASPSNSNMVKFSNKMIKPVLLLVGRQESKQVPSLMMKCLQILHVAMLTFPMQMVDLLDSKLGNSLFTIFDEYMAFVSKNQSNDFGSTETTTNLITSTTSASSNQSTSNNAVITSSWDRLYTVEAMHSLEQRAELENRGEVIFNLYQTLLLCGGLYISSATRHKISKNVVIGLQSMHQGVSPSHYLPYDRRLKRSFEDTALLRCSTLLQLSFLQLAETEVTLISHLDKGGMLYSTALTLLKDVCIASQGMMTVTSEGMRLAIQAKKTLCIIGHVLNPATIPVPALSSADLILQQLQMYKQQQEQLAELQKRNESIAGKIVDAQEQQPDSMNITTEDDKPAASKGKNNATKVASNSEMFAMNKQVKAKVTSTTTTAGNKRKLADDDDDLPDLDLNSEPDE